jgi:hypothetical protein
MSEKANLGFDKSKFDPSKAPSQAEHMANRASENAAMAVDNGILLSKLVMDIGARVDAASVNTANATLKKVQFNWLNVSKAVVESFTALVGVSATVVYAVEEIAKEFNELYFAAQRSGTTVQSMKSLGYAAEQLGIDGKSAEESLANLARFMRNNAAGEGILNGLGIGTREANGELRDTKDILVDVLGRLQHMPQFQANHIAEMLGIDENLRLTDVKQLTGFMDEASAAAKEMGVNMEDLSVQGNQFSTTMHRLGLYVDIFKARLMSLLAPGLKKGLDELGKYFVTHQEEIVHALTTVSTLLIEFVGVMVKLVIGAAIFIDKMMKFADEHKTLIGILEALIPLVLTVGAAFLAIANPITAVVAAITALIAGIVWFTTQGGFLKEIRKEIGDFIGELLQIVDIISAPINFLRIKLGLPVGSFYDAFKPYLGNSTPQTAPESKGTRGNRNNNPGNLKFAPWEAGYGATGAETNGPFAQFGTLEQGASALRALLLRYGSRGLNTVQSIINTYAPGSENNTSAYVNDVAKNMGVGSNSALDLTNPATLDAMMKAISRHEGTYNAAVGSAIDKVNNVTISQSNTFNIDGSKSPEATAQAVAGKLGATANLRNLKPVVQ